METFPLSAIHERISIREVKVSAFTIPTDRPESDGTLKWNSTTMVLVEIEGGGKTGVGYTYADAATAFYIEHTLKPRLLEENDAMDIPSLTQKLRQSIRNQGTTGIAMMAVSAIDCALWDLKGKLLETSVALLLGKEREEIAVYGSGGFTSYSPTELEDQLQGWVELGIGAVKMKIGRRPENDLNRVKLARKAIGDAVQLYVDANGAYHAREAVAKANDFVQYNVTWFEEPVTADDARSMRFVKAHKPDTIHIAAGEYCYHLLSFERLLESKTIDILQADATRCGGISGFLVAGHLSETYNIPFSSHCAPSLHQQAILSLPTFFTAEYFHDHVRIEQMLFDNSLHLEEGSLKPDLTRPGLGLIFKHSDAEKFKL